MTEEQAALRDAIRAVLAGPAERVWAGLTEVGVPGLAVPEKSGGAGASLTEVAIAVAETGRVLLPLPVLSTALAGLVLRDTRSEFLTEIAAGRMTAAFVLDGDIQYTDGRLTGTAQHVLDGAEAGILLVRVGQALFAVKEVFAVQGAHLVEQNSLDETRSQATVRLDRAPAVLTGADPRRAQDLLRVLLAVEAAEAAAHCLDATVAYLRTRVQFGRPLAGFQALRHRCADLAVEVAAARATAWAAVSRPDELAALAKVYCADVCWHVAAEMVQLHGGIGFTWEHEAHRYLKRAKSTQLLGGSRRELRASIAGSLRG
jgi:alkylation response protein AidB-like acyl-CoA dehydrogenase